jgi:hypothetical protein
LKNYLYPSADKEILLEAFRVLDTDKNGYLDLHTYYHFLRHFGISFTKEQISEMDEFLSNNETEFLEATKLNVENESESTRQKHSPYKTRKFYYESYVYKVLNDNKKHFDCLMVEYKIFKQKQKESKQEAASA